jgi:RND family efflux transporter MFP subunit
MATPADSSRTAVGAPQAQAGGRGPGPGGFARGGMTPAITTASVAAANVGRTIDAVGFGRAAKSVNMVSEATGLVESVPANAGTAVRAGGVILKLDDSEQKIALARARAQYPIAKANSERFTALYQEDSASKLEADTAFNAFKSAEAEMKAAEFALKQRTIRAPFDGVVGLTTIEPGAYVRAGDVVMTIDDLSALIVEFSVPQEEAAGVRLTQKVEAFLAGGGGGRMEGLVSAIDSRVDPASRTLKIEATFPNESGSLLPGATYAVTTTNDGAPALSVPGLAVQWDRTGAYVWKVGKDGAVARTGVAILQRRDEIALVDGDLKPGDVVIVEGADRVRPGMIFPQTSSLSVGAGSGRSAGAL